MADAVSSFVGLMSAGLLASHSQAVVPYANIWIQLLDVMAKRKSEEPLRHCSFCVVGHVTVTCPCDCGPGVV